MLVGKMVGRKLKINILHQLLIEKERRKKVLISALAFERGNSMRKDLGGEQE